MRIEAAKYKFSVSDVHEIEIGPDQFLIVKFVKH
jgi:hypothetical protein